MMTKRLILDDILKIITRVLSAGKDFGKRGETLERCGVRGSVPSDEGSKSSIYLTRELDSLIARLKIELVRIISRSPLIERIESNNRCIKRIHRSQRDIASRVTGMRFKNNPRPPSRRFRREQRAHICPSGEET